MSSVNMCKYLFGGEITEHGINLGGLAKVVSVRLVFGHDTFERALSQLFYQSCSLTTECLTHQNCHPEIKV